MIKAVWDAIIVQVDEKTEKMHGKFIIPDLSQEKAIVGTIIDVGPGRVNDAGKLIPTAFKIGQKVILPKIGPVRVEYDGEEYLVTGENNVLALIQTEENE